MKNLKGDIYKEVGRIRCYSSWFNRRTYNHYRVFKVCDEIEQLFNASAEIERGLHRIIENHVKNETTREV